ncbi:16S rRNA m(4)C1402 methyltransferase [compost metagenome]
MPMVEEKPAIFDALGKPMIAATEEEAALNPRARSAKLRAGVRTTATAPKADVSIFELPDLASLEKLGG